MGHTTMEYVVSADAVDALRRGKAILLAATVALCLLALPLTIAFGAIGWRLLFNLLAGDSMYYMGIANNWVKFGFPTFDGEQITNGFHPLWELLLAGTFWSCGIPNTYQIYVTVFLSFAFVLVSVTLLGSVSIRRFGAVKGTTGILLMFPGAYTLLCNPDSRGGWDPGVLYRLEPWSAINGMESALSLALWSLAIYLLVERTEPSLKTNAPIDQSGDWLSVFNYPVRVVLAAIVLTRLDDAIVLAPIVLVVWIFSSGTTRQRIQQISQILLLPVAAILVYTFVNVAATGGPLPTSGVSKTGLAIESNVSAMAGALLGFANGWGWEPVAQRSYPLIFCLVLSGISLFLLNTVLKEIRDTSRLHQITLAFFIYVLIKTLFFIGFVDISWQGYWYDFVIVLMLNFVIAMILVRMIPTRGIYKYVAFTGAAMVTTLALGTEVHLMSLRESKLGDNEISYAEIEYTLWSHKQEIREAFNKRDPAAKLIDNDDGMYGFLLDMPAVSVTGLASGRKDLADRSRLGFWNSVLPRGYSIISSAGYMDASKEKGIRFREFFRTTDGKVVFFQAISTEVDGAAGPK